MLWLITSDIQKIIEHKSKNTLVFPTVDEIRAKLKEINTDNEWKSFVVISNKMPYSEFNNIFVVRNLLNENFLTTQEKYHGITEEEALENKLNLVTRRPKLTYEDMQGFEKVVDIFKRIDYKKQHDKMYKNKPIFLLGMAGTGKSRVAEAYAGEHNIPLIDLNISAVAEANAPIKKLNEIFSVLSSAKKEIVLRLDEFEQMSKNEDLLGEMLTILNDLNAGGYNFNGMIILTSNNISDLTYKMPQFFRHGRFSEKLFISFPKKENVTKVMQYYNNKYNINFSNNDLEKIYLTIETVYKKDNFAWQENRSPYVPAEIEALFSVLSDRTKNGEIDKEAIKRAVSEVKPLLVTSREGVQKMYQKAIEQDFLEI